MPRLCPAGQENFFWQRFSSRINDFQYFFENAFDMFKKGDARCLDNYRPISVLPIIYKLFSKIMCQRIRATLDLQQAVDQAGFRSGYSCDDHIFTITLMSEMFAEFRTPLWVVAIDFRKAFDSLEHSSLWAALDE